jgi:chromosome segregation protein
LARLTRGSLAGFTVDFDDRDAPRLAARRAGTGLPVPVSGLSEGTRDQLWLALRLAAVERHAAAGEPLPFVGDDVFVNFDDERTIASLEALADLGAGCQVLLFTHHRHVVDLARDSIGPRMALVEI